jgi:hypothetical protein
MKQKQIRKAHPLLQLINQHPWTGSGKTPGTGSRSNHREARKEIVEKQNRIVSEAKEDAEKRRRNKAKETREKEDRDNQKTNSGSS